MAKSFSHGSIMNEQTLSQARDSHKVVYVKFENIFPNPQSSKVYETSNIDLLSYDIEDRGILEPLLVILSQNSSDSKREMYQLVSGHRRRLAILKILERNSPKAKDFNYVPCIVQKIPKGISEEEKEEYVKELILDGNFFNRVKTEAEIAKEISIKKEILQKRKNSGDVLAGKLLDLIAGEMGISVHQAKKFNSINMNASDTVKEAFGSGVLSTESAYELSKADEETQNEILETELNQGGSLTAKTVKEAIEKKKQSQNEIDAHGDSQHNQEDKPKKKRKTSSKDNDLDTQALPYGYDNSESNGKDGSEQKQTSRLSVISDLAWLMKAFATSTERIVFHEDEIKKTQSVLNTIYIYLSSVK